MTPIHLQLYFEQAHANRGKRFRLRKWIIINGA